MSTLFPALKVLGEGADRVFYLTAKTITRQVAEDALSKLADNGSETKSVTITAKDKFAFWMNETVRQSIVLMHKAITIESTKLCGICCITKTK